MSSSRKLNTKASGVIAVAVMCSRVLGLVREMLFSGLFGSKLMGIFIIAFRAPNLLRDLFAEGALSTAFITVFAKRIETEGDLSAWSLASKMMTLVAIFMSGVSLLGVLFAKQLVGLLAPGFDPADAHFTILLTQIMYPFILLVSLAALVMGMLNAKNVFGMPAMASTFFNIGSILGGVFFGWLLDHQFGERALIGLSIGTLVGGLMQFAVQIPSLWKVGFHFRPDFRWDDPGIKKILVLMVPSVIAASAVQINVMVNSSFASYVGVEAVTWLNNAFRLMQFPIGVFGVAVATITLPVVSRIAAHSDRREFGPTLGKAMRLAVFLTMPSAVGLYFLAEPIISLLYQHHHFLARDAWETSYALQSYALGLISYSCIKVLSPAFYAIDKKWTPMMVSFGSIGLNLGLNYLFIFHLHWGQRGLALSTTISATMNFLVLYPLMKHHAGTLHTKRFLSTILRCGVAAEALGIVCWAGKHWSHDWVFGDSFIKKSAALMVMIGISIVVYMGVCLLFRVEEVQSMRKIVVGKLSRKLKRA